MNTTFKVYAPLTTKNNNDDSLTIEGVASTTTKDLQGDIMLPSAIQSMKQQAKGLNLLGDHQYGLDNIIGTITEVVDTDDDTLKIKAKILPTYAPTLKEMLETGVKLGLSIGGNIQEYQPQKDGWEIKDIRLHEISLTGMPANWDTMGTITTSKGIVLSKSIACACNKILEGEKQMPEETQALTEETVVNLINEALASKQEEIEELINEKVEEAISNIQQNKAEEEEEEPVEAKAETTPEEEEEQAKHIENLIEKKFGELYKKIDETRNPAPQVNKAIKQAEKEEVAEAKKTFTPEEAAKALMGRRKNNPVDMLLNNI